ncbi:MAG: asparagine synthase (glutamine-hydrolyzing) [Chitinophagaceae bacterium]|nr:asparagine synthase (glutamine-hydrolyzing) [Chitinophagaceae bacterium]
MCGIAGSINLSFDHSALFKELYHRGPDEQVTYLYNNLSLFHFRLAIQDIACGMQPIHINDLTIIYNGEIYNHDELKIKYNLKCNTNSDTEVLLRLYELKGIKILDEVDGMFAAAILNRATNELILLRDRAGKKPLYFYQEKDQFVFCSELNGLQKMLPLEVNYQQLYTYFQNGFNYKTATPYKSTYLLPPGCSAHVSLDDGSFKIHEWWNIEKYYHTKSNDDLETAMQKVDALLHTAVKRRLESSDLEVGVFLSGGIDSTIITAIASEYNKNLKTFTVKFDGGYDESMYAGMVAKKYNTHHQLIDISLSNLKNDIEKILINYGEPFYDSSAIPTYYISKEAKKYITVVLNGDGADELFGGYRRYVPFSKMDLFSNNSFRRLSALVSSVLPNPQGKQSKYNYIFRLMKLASAKGINLYNAATIDTIAGMDVFKQTALFEQTNDAGFETDLLRIAGSKLSGLDKIMLLDFISILPGMLLKKMDIGSMAHSLETRSPFLSKEIMEYAPGLNDSFKVKNVTTKYLLRNLAKKYLPPEMIDQPKRGFEIPLDAWVNNELKDMIIGSIQQEGSLSSLFFEKPFLEGLIDKKLNIETEKRSKILWQLFTAETWYKNHVLNCAHKEPYAKESVDCC